MTEFVTKSSLEPENVIHSGSNDLTKGSVEEVNDQFKELINVINNSKHLLIISLKEIQRLYIINRREMVWKLLSVQKVSYCPAF